MHKLFLNFFNFEDGFIYIEIQRYLKRMYKKNGYFGGGSNPEPPPLEYGHDVRRTDNGAVD